MFSELDSELPEQTDSLWVESMKWATATLNIMATTPNPWKVSQLEMYHGHRPTLTLLPFLSPVEFHFKRARKSYPHERPSCLLGPARNYPADAVRILDVESRAVMATPDVVRIEYTLTPELKEDTIASSTQQGGNYDDEEQGETEESK